MDKIKKTIATAWGIVVIVFACYSTFQIAKVANAETIPVLKTAYAEVVSEPKPKNANALEKQKRIKAKTQKHRDVEQ